MNPEYDHPEARSFKYHNYIREGRGRAPTGLFLTYPGGPRNAGVPEICRSLLRHWGFASGYCRIGLLNWLYCWFSEKPEVPGLAEAHE